MAGSTGEAARLLAGDSASEDDRPSVSRRRWRSPFCPGGGGDGARGGDGGSGSDGGGSIAWVGGGGSAAAAAFEPPAPVNKRPNAYICSARGTPRTCTAVRRASGKYCQPSNVARSNSACRKQNVG